MLINHFHPQMIFPLQYGATMAVQEVMEWRLNYWSRPTQDTLSSKIDTTILCQVEITFFLAMLPIMGFKCHFINAINPLHNNLHHHQHSWIGRIFYIQINQARNQLSTSHCSFKGWPQLSSCKIGGKEKNKWNFLTKKGQPVIY